MRDLAPADVEMRRAARERALELLYETEVKGTELDDLLAALPLAPADLALELVRGVEANRPAIDELLGKRVAPRWSLNRLAAVDRAILRLASYELMGAPQRSDAVILNEAVVLARRFGTDDSPRFVNGVLAAVAADVRGETTPRDATLPRLVDGLVIDLDGVIRHWDEDAVTEGDEALGLPPGTLAGAAFEADRLERSMRGLLTAEEWYAEAGEAIAVDHDIDPAAAAEVMAQIGWSIDESVMELVDLVRLHVPVAVLSNASTRLVADLELSGIADRFDAVVGSASLGVVKPEADAYRAATEALGVAPDRCMFVDDRPENVEGAAELGMRAVRFSGVDALATELERAGLLDILVGAADE